MKVLAVVMGSEGDMVPFTHLGTALRLRGHEMAMAGFAEFADRFAGEGIEYVSLPGDCQAMMKRLLGDTKGVVDTVRGVREMVGDPVIYQALERAMDGVDVVLHNQFGDMVRLLAAARGVPSVRVQVYPTEPCRSYSMVNPRRLDGTTAAAVVHAVSNVLMAWAMHPVMKQWRHRLGVRRWVLHRSPPTLYQFSPALTPPVRAWGAHVHVTGEWLDPEPLVATPDEKVTNFLLKGQAPLLVSFGSVVSDRMRNLRTWVREALAEQGLRAIIVDPTQQAQEADGILTVDRVPFDSVLPSCRAVVCHGSLGTTGASLRAGKPCLTVAFGGDQHFHAQAVWRNGAGPEYIDAQRGELTRQAVAAGIADLVSGRYDTRASEMPALLATDPGVTAAVDVVIRLGTKHREASTGRRRQPQEATP